ncbi:GntR family transcriptional regulator [Erwinia sp. BNK-24-b]|uniref:GntR family transcriptional regulator n=1 Tax=unclassified Erwinia TaxID=2622719 RepID=UPI0039BFC68E
MTKTLSPLFYVDNDSTMPLYMQLVKSLQTAVRKGKVQPGDIIPSERTLVKTLGIARGTARRAYQTLLENGTIVRKRGSGTFIAPLVRQLPGVLESFSEMAEKCGGTPQSELLGCQRRESTAEEQQALCLTENQKVLEIIRLRKINDIAISLQLAVLPDDLLEELSNANTSLYLLLAQKGMPVVRAIQRFSAVAANGKLACHLQIKESDPLLLVTRTGYSHCDRPVEYTRTWCLNEYYDFTVALHRDRDDARPLLL